MRANEQSSIFVKEIKKVAVVDGNVKHPCPLLWSRIPLIVNVYQKVILLHHHYEFQKQAIFSE